MSRSVTIAIAYLMSITSSPLSDAEKMVRGARPISNPNSGFLKQLQEFEGSPRLFEVTIHASINPKNLAHFPH